MSKFTYPTVWDVEVMAVDTDHYLVKQLNSDKIMLVPVEDIIDGWDVPTTIGGVGTKGVLVCEGYHAESAEWL